MPLQDLPDRRSYSDRTALICAKLSTWSYIDFDTDSRRLEKKLTDNGLMLLDTISREKPLANLKRIELLDTQAIWVVHMDSGTSFICFRGTEPKDLTDWYTDAQIKRKKAGEGIKLHRGFLEAYRLVKTDIRNWLKKSRGKPVFLCGHSLGGALATVATVLNQDLPIASCYTFGGPRVGAIDSTRVKTPVYRVTNALDPVPDFPPATFFVSEYRHLGDEYKLHDGVLNPELITGDRVVDQISETLDEIVLFFQNLVQSRLQEGIRHAIKAKGGAHAKELYIKRLKAIAEARN